MNGIYFALQTQNKNSAMGGSRADEEGIIPLNMASLPNEVQVGVAAVSSG